MNENDFIQELDNKEIDMMLKYVPAYSSDNAINIKKKFVQKAKARQKKFSIKKLTLIAAAASMILVTTLVYADVIDINRIYRIIFGEKSEYIEPYIKPLSDNENHALIYENDNGDINESVVLDEEPLSIQSEYDGMVMKLISAINDENVLRIFATLTDTTGDRLGQQMDFTSWGLNQGHGGNISVVDYNHATKTATLLITSLGSDHQGIATLMVNNISTGRELLEGLPEKNINISTLLSEHAPSIVSQDELLAQGGAYADHELGRRRWEDTRLLKFDEMDIKFDHTTMFSISNIGFVDGVLHIQVKAVLTGIARTDGYFISLGFVNAANEVIYGEPKNYSDTILLYADRNYAYGFYREEAPYIVEYMEFIYNEITTPEQLNDLSMTITYMKSPQIIDGHWEFSFLVPKKVTTEFQVDREFQINGERMKIELISLSPLGVTIHLPINISHDYIHNDAVYVEYIDGVIVDLNQTYLQTYENESSLHFGGPIVEIEKVKSIIINGERINTMP